MSAIVVYLLSFFRMVLRIFANTVYSVFSRIFSHYKDISDDIILITGGGRGLGRQLALEFAEYKPKHIILWGRNKENLSRTRNDVLRKGVDCTFFQCDVSSRETIYKKAEEVAGTVGDVSILVNNAGVVFGKQIIDAVETEVIHTIRVNALAQIWTTKAFLPTMIDRQRGHIVCMSSMLGLLGMKATADYTASKFATTGLMESLADEVQEYRGINTTIIHPYQVDNNMFAGCRVRFPRLFAPLKEDVVTKTTVKAVLTNRKQVIMPLYFHPVLFLRSLLPVDSLTPALKFMGLDRAMDSFHSHTEHTKSS